MQQRRKAKGETDNIRALNGGESVWPEGDRTGQGRAEGIHFSDHHRTADALMDEGRRSAATLKLSLVKMLCIFITKILCFIQLSYILGYWFCVFMWEFIKGVTTLSPN